MIEKGSRKMIPGFAVTLLSLWMMGPLREQASHQDRAPAPAGQEVVHGIQYGAGDPGQVLDLYLPAQSERSAGALRGAGVDVQYITVPGADHDSILDTPAFVAMEAHIERVSRERKRGDRPGAVTPWYPTG